MMNFWDSKFIEFNGQKICPFCGKKLSLYTEISGSTEIDWWNCNCDDALKEALIQKDIKNLQLQLPKEKYKIGMSIIPIM